MTAAATGASGPPWWFWFIIGLAATVAFSGDVYVYHDARSRGLTRRQTASWIAGCLFMWVIWFPLWFVMRGDYGDDNPDELPK